MTFINRRRFLGATSAGLAAALAGPGIWSVAALASDRRKVEFRPYTIADPAVPVTCVTPDDGFYLHTFYDICPWSPDSRYLLVTKFPYQRRKPEWGTSADLCLIDLQEQTIETIYRSKAWSYQLGISAQWDSVNNHFVYTNDVIDGKPVCVRIDLRSRQVRAFSGSMYSVSPDGKYVASANLMTMNTHQYGYAVPDNHPKPNQFTEADMAGEGLWRTNLETDETELLVPFSEFTSKLDDPAHYKGHIFYLFHTKYNSTGDRIMQVFRSQKNGRGRNASLFTVGADGSDLIQCLTRKEWATEGDMSAGGNHPNWHPDGKHIVMNLVPRWQGETEMRICKFRYDGSDLQVLAPGHISSGHPTAHPGGRYTVTDAYVKQTYTVGEDRLIPVRLYDAETGKETVLARISNDVGAGKIPHTKIDKKTGGSAHKLDPHPAWNRDYTQLCINGAPEQRRQVYIMDLKEILS